MISGNAVNGEGERQWHHDTVIMCERGKDKRHEDDEWKVMREEWKWDVRGVKKNEKDKGKGEGWITTKTWDEGGVRGEGTRSTYPWHLTYTHSLIDISNFSPGSVQQKVATMFLWCNHSQDFCHKLECVSAGFPCRLPKTNEKNMVMNGGGWGDQAVHMYKALRKMQTSACHTIVLLR